ncbi:MAG: hypothetical protein O3C45_06490 [Bacteroidetes bacterium]|nr:hypothetical protein [Bacteroidota bacterium]MDA0874698.1 hypothetical protein [Bacteroidota bacterium]
MKRFLNLSLALLVLGLAALPMQTALAQKPDKDSHRTVIEIKDGKVLLNGKEVAEIEDEDAPLVFKRSGEDITSRLWNLDEGPGGRASGFVLHSDDGEGYRLRTMPRAYGFMSEDGAKAEFFSDRDFQEIFEVREKARRQTSEAMAELERAMPALSLYAERGAVSQRALEAEQRSRELARSIRKGDGDAEALEAELSELLGQVFDEKQAAQQERIDRLRQQLTDLEQRMQQRQEDRNQIISKRKDQLLGRDSRFDW